MTGEKDVGHDVTDDQDEVADAQRVGGLDVRRLAHDQHRAAYHPGHARRVHDADRGMMTLSTLGPSAAISAMASTIAGNAMSPSMMRMITLSRRR